MKCLLLPKSTPPCQNIPPPFQQLNASNPPRIYPSLPEYTPLFNEYMRPSQNPPLPPRLRIYLPFFNKYMGHSQNLPLPPRIYPPLYNNYLPHSQNQPLPTRIYPPFQQLLYYATLPQPTPSAQNILPFLTTMCDTPRIYRSLPEYTPSLFNSYMRPS